MDMPEMTLDKAVAALFQRDEYKFILGMVHDERERLIKELGSLSDPHEIMKFSGGIARLDEMLDLLMPSS